MNTPGKGHIIKVRDEDAGHLEECELDCQTCGACCTHGGEVIVPHGDPDIPHNLRRSVRPSIGYASWEYELHSAMARRKDGACIAFHGIVGDPCGCEIYAARPDCCRYFERGSEDCRLARTSAGLGDAAAF